MSTKTKKAAGVETADFRPFARAVLARFEELSRHELYVTDCDDLYEKYLAAFPPGTNPVHLVRTVHDCNTCKQFIRRLGKLVAIRDGKVLTVWGGLKAVEHPFEEVAAALDAAVKAARVLTVFRTKERQYGVEHNVGSNGVKNYHLWGKVADRHFAATPDTKRGEQEAIFQVMRRGLSVIGDTDLGTVIDLIDSNGLYRGAEFRAKVVGFRELKRRYVDRDTDADPTGDLFVWENLGNPHGRFRNDVIGTLLVDMAEGKDLDQAVRAFETKVAPANYKRPTAVITQRMVDDALATINKLDLGGAIARRFLKLSDVSVNDVLFVDNDTRGKMKDGLAAVLEGSVRKAPPDLKKATRVAADEFVRDVLPGARTLDLFLENRHQGNFVSLTTSDDPARLFKWDSPAAWSYDGDTTDSVKQRVKAAGGRIDCKLRVSLSWFNTDDLDLHAFTPSGTHIHFGNKAGILDVDMNVRGETRTPVENLAFNHLEDGVYKVAVNQYRRRETADVGFAIEVEYGGQVHQHSYGKSLADRENVECFRLHVKKGELVKVETDLPGGSVSQEKWGVKTEQLVPVAAAMFSPNHWGDSAVGARHLIFALKGCKNPGPTRGVYNEFLRSDLERHRKVFEVLGNKTKCPPADEQVSGVGFTAARGDSVTLVVDGRRAYTLTF